MAAVLDQQFEGKGSLEARLNAFGSTLMAFLFQADHIALDRILAQEMAQHPDLASRFFEAGPGNCHNRLSQVIAYAEANGELDIDTPGLAADDLIGLWKGFADIELKFGVSQPPDAQKIQFKVQRGTRLFLKLYAAVR